MTELTNILESGELALPQQEEPLPLLSLLTVPFIIGVVAFSPLDGWNYAVKILGVILALAFFVRSLSSSLRVNKEVLLYMAWILWSFTGAFVALHIEQLWEILITVAQILIMLFIVAGATYLRKTLTINLVAFLAGTFIIGIYSLVTGEYARPDDPSGRVAGIAMNANSFGFIMVLGTMVLAYLWMLPHRHPWMWYGPLALAMGCAAVASVLSGSRTSIVSLGVLYITWIFFCYRAEIFHRPKVFAGVVFACILGVVFFLYLFVGSLAEERFESASTVLQGGGGGEGSVAARIQLFKDGLHMLAGSPVFGIGLNQFIFLSSSGHVAHSEYMEIFADTGIVGGVIYFSIFVVLWIRAGKIAKYTDDLTQFRIARLVRAFLIVIMVSNVGRWNYYDKMTWILFASFIGYTGAVWRELSNRPAAVLADEQTQLQA
jgi:O-antigen ligase